MPPNDRERNRFTARARRYAKVGTQLSGTAARFAGARFFGVPLDRAANALELAAALGATSYIVKPVSYEELCRIVAELLARFGITNGKDRPGS